MGCRRDADDTKNEMQPSTGVEPLAPVDGSIHCPCCGDHLDNALVCQNPTCGRSWQRYLHLFSAHQSRPDILRQVLAIYDPFAAIFPPSGERPLTPITDQWVDQVRVNGPHGGALLAGGSDFENGVLSVQIVHDKQGKEYVILSGRLAPDAADPVQNSPVPEANLLASLKLEEPIQVQSLIVNEIYGRLPIDQRNQLFERLTAVQQAINQLDAQKSDQDDINAAFEALDEIQSILDAACGDGSGLSNSEQAFQAYCTLHLNGMYDHLEEILDGTTPAAIPDIPPFEGYYLKDRVVQDTLNPSDKGLKVVQIAGDVQVDQDNCLQGISVYDLPDDPQSFQGYRIALNEDQGWYGFYYPYGTQAERTNKGVLRVVSPERTQVTANDIAQAVACLQRIGLPGFLSSREEAELAYLESNAWGMALVKDPQYHQCLVWNTAETESVYQNAQKMMDALPSIPNEKIEQAAKGALLQAYQSVKSRRIPVLRKLLADAMGMSVSKMLRLPTYLSILKSSPATPISAPAALHWGRVVVDAPSLENFTVMDFRGKTVEDLLACIDSGAIIWSRQQSARRGLEPIGEDLDQPPDHLSGRLIPSQALFSPTYDVRLAWHSPSWLTRTDARISQGDTVRVKDAVSLYSMPPNIIYVRTQSHKDRLIQAFQDRGVVRLGRVRVGDCIQVLPDE